VPEDAEERKQLVTAAIDETINRQGLTLSAREREEKIESTVRELPNVADKIMREVIAKRSGVLCMSGTPVNSQQWAYYAGNHFGICIGIDMSHVNNESREKINYVPNRTALSLEDLLTEKEGIGSEVFAAVITKHVSWEHEEEFRFFSNTVGPIGFPSEHLVVVYFGINCESTTVDYVDRILRRTDSDPIFGVVQPSQTEYKLLVAEGLSTSEVKEYLIEGRRRISEVG